MSRVGDQLSSLWPALAFLLAGVPLAALLDRLGFFDAVATVVVGRGRSTPVWWLWALAAVTTVVLNLDTTVVLLTPLYLRLARRLRVDELDLVAIALLLASLASSVLPVSNLTTLIVVDRFGTGVGDVVTHLALPSVVATVTGWFAYRRHRVTVLPAGLHEDADSRALRIGGVVVAGLLVGFVAGPSHGVDPWVTALVADAVLLAVVRRISWRDVPTGTACFVVAVAVVTALAVPTTLLGDAMRESRAAVLFLVALAGAAAANVVNNLPALLAAIDAVHHPTWGVWAWLLGVNVGAALLPLGALANLLWWRVARDQGVAVDLRGYLRVTIPVVVPALVAAGLTLVAERALGG
jgi:arsenical pump membrane protein